MKLLLDEMFPAIVAVRLRTHGADAVAVQEEPRLRGRPDDEVFAAAQDDRRAIVTENVRDFRPIAGTWEAAGGAHFGLIFTTNRLFPRAQPRTIGRLVLALARLTEGEPRAALASNREIWL